MARQVSAFKAYAQIQRQPDELARLLETDDGLDAAAEAIGQGRRVFCIGTATSFSAAMLAGQWLRHLGFDASTWSAFDFCEFGPRLRPSDTGIVFSHSGHRHYSRRALERLQAARSTSVWITAQIPDVSNAASVTLHTVAREPSAMATVSYTAALLVMARVCDLLRPDALGEVAAVPAAVREALATQPAVAGIATRWAAAGMVCAIGGGPHEASARELAIKLNEGPRMRAGGYSVDQFLHGPQIQLAQGDALVVFASAGAALERTNVVAQLGVDVGTEVAWISALSAPDDAEAVPVPDLGEWLAPVVEVVPGQLLAACLAAERDVDCDSFRDDDPRFHRAYDRFSL